MTNYDPATYWKINHPQFVDLLLDGNHVATAMATLVFSPDGTITNAEEIKFESTRTRRGGLAQIRVLDNEIFVDTGQPHHCLRPGDSMVIPSGGLRIQMFPTQQTTESDNS